MESRILVPLDGSRLAEQALSCAAMLGRGLPSELVLFRAVSVPSDDQEILVKAGIETEALLAQLEVDAQVYLAGLVEQLAAQRLNVRHVVERGPAAEAILDYCEQEKIDQIVMATHGYSGIKRWTHGSVAERVLQTSSVPVLLLRAREKDEAAGWEKPMQCRRILVPLDGSKVAEQVLPIATMVAQALDADLILLQVPIVHAYGWLTDEWFLPVQGVLATAEQDAEAYLNAVVRDLKEQNLRITGATIIGPVAASILEYAEVNGVDLIAMCTHGRTGLARWALGSVADHVLRAGNIPVLLVRASTGR
jgi:nucleotide-binding universal stress UspA family protein